MIVRINSHRADHKLNRIVEDAPCLYDKMLKYGGIFAEVPEVVNTEVLAITGITKCRDQDRDNYATCWRTT